MNDDLTRAEAERDRSRARFRATVANARERLDPARLRAEGSEFASQALSTVPKRMIDEARKRPQIIAAVASSIALLLFRKPIFGALKRLTQEKNNG